MTRPFLFANKPVKAGLYKNKSKTIVTRMKNVSTALLFVVCMMLPQVGNAQEKKWIDFFSASLAGDVREISKEKSLKVKNIEKARAEMWKSWVKANEMFDEEKLVALEDLDKGVSSTWHLPEELEPSADMNYYYGFKGEAPEEGYPFFLYLHGSGPRDREWATGLKLAKMFDDAPSIYFVPQIPNEGKYYRWYQKSKQYAWDKLIRQMLLRPDVDPNRFYLFGISEGGYGSQRLASYYADYLAAAGPMAGGEPLKNAPAENCRHIGFSLRTGSHDYSFYRNVLTEFTRVAFDSLAQVYPGQYPHKIELIQGYGHSIDYAPTPVWLKQFVRNPWPKQVTWEDYEVDSLYRKGFYNIEVLERPDKDLRTRYDMTIEGNHIDLTVRDVHYTATMIEPRWDIEMKFEKEYTDAKRGRMLIYLNEHLVDLEKPVTLVVNGREVFKGKVKCSKGHMARSLATFYDPERIYPAAIEVVL